MLQVAIILAIGFYFQRFLSIPDYNSNIKLIFAITLGYASLIFPVVLGALLFEGKLRYIFFLHSIFGIILLLYYTLQFLQNLHHTYWKIGQFKDTLNFVDVTIGLLVVGYAILLLLFDLRGYDALHFYIPNAFYFFIQDDIPAGINPLSFFPTFKPPANVIMMMQGLYLSRDFTYELHSLLLLLGTALIIHEACKELGLSKFHAKLGVIIFLTLPFTYHLMAEYALYQEPAIMFFYATALYAMKNLSKRGFSILVTISSSLAILSKMSGYSVFILLFLIPNGSRNFRRLQISGLVLVFYQLFRKGSENYYLNVYPLMIFLLFLIWQNYRGLLSKHHFDVGDYVKILLLPLVFAIGWLLFMLQIHDIDQFLLNTYVRTTQDVSYIFQGLTPGATFVENGMGVNFFSSIFYIGVGSLFNPILFPFLLIGIFSKETRYYSMWLVLFYAIWFAYFGTVSGRYLAPLLVPYVVCIVKGISNIQKMASLHLQRSFALFLPMMSALFIYPFIPVRLISLQTNFRFFNFYKELILVVSSSLLLFIFIFRVVSAKKIRFNKYYKWFIVFSLSLAPFSLPYGGIVSTGFDKDQFNEQFNYHSRTEYRELIDFLIDININEDTKLISVDTPGLEYFILRSVLDLGIISSSANLSTNLFSSNQSQVLEFMDTNQFEIVIGLNSSHVFFTEFQNRYVERSIFQLALNSSFFGKVYQNAEFLVYQRLNH